MSVAAETIAGTNTAALLSNVSTTARRSSSAPALAGPNVVSRSEIVVTARGAAQPDRVVEAGTVAARSHNWIVCRSFGQSCLAKSEARISGVMALRISANAARAKISIARGCGARSDGSGNGRIGAGRAGEIISMASSPREKGGAPAAIHHDYPARLRPLHDQR
jgi:hypothetical protein